MTINFTLIILLVGYVNNIFFINEECLTLYHTTKKEFLIIKIYVLTSRWITWWKMTTMSMDTFSSSDCSHFIQRLSLFIYSQNYWNEGISFTHLTALTSNELTRRVHVSVLRKKVVKIFFIHQIPIKSHY